MAKYVTNFNNLPTQFQDINNLLVTIDWFGRALTVYTIGNFLHEQVQKLIKSNRPLTLLLWGGKIGGLVPIMNKDGKWEIIQANLLKQETNIDMNCLVCFNRSKILFNFFDSPSEEIVPVCKSCTKIILRKLKKKEELFLDEQRKVWFKVRIGEVLTAEERKIYDRYSNSSLTHQ